LSRLLFIFVFGGVGLGLATESYAQLKSKSEGEVGVSSRAFYPDDDPDTEDYGLALEAELELQSKVGGFRNQIQVFGRVGALDNDRSTVFLKDAWLGYRDEYIDVRLGTQVLNWTATEAFHPSDNINSRNLDSNIENAEKIGEPMGSFRLRWEEGGMTGYFMPVRMEPRLPGPRSRLSVTQGQSLGSPLWGGTDGAVNDDWFAPQWAVRLDQTLGSADLAVYYVDHQDRSQPAIVLSLASQEARALFTRVQRIGGTYTHALGEWLVKAEVDHRLFTKPTLESGQVLVREVSVDHTSAALGLEWGWGYEEAEGTVLLEGQAAIAPDATPAEQQQLGPFQRDVLVGYRHSFNNAASTELLFGAIVDLEDPTEVLGNMDFSHRLSDNWVMRGSGRVVFASNEESLLKSLDEAHSLQLSVIRYF
jgi:hypothetical protein